VSDPYGPQYPDDDGFTARMRFHQSWWRHERLCEQVGTDPKDNPYGNYLTALAAGAGRNFLNASIAAYAAERISAGGGVEEFRCTRNLLSSQPMAFNLFGPLHLDADLARVLLQPLLPHGVSEATVDIEWAPDRKTHLKDATSFDVVVHYKTADGKAAIAAIETKLTEPFSRKKYDTPRYREVAAKSSVWADPTSPELARVAWNQVWRNHLLVEAIRQQPEADADLLGYAIVVHHPADERCIRATDGYRALLAPPPESFLVLTLTEIVETWQPVVAQTAHVEWLGDFTDRYLNLELSEDAWSARTSDDGAPSPTPEISTVSTMSFPPASPLAQAAVERAAGDLRASGVSSVTPPELFAAANDAAWDLGYMLSSADVWTAVYAWKGFDYGNPPPDDTPMSL